jgi:thymidylate synthase
MTQGPSFQMLKTLYFTLDQNFNELFGACQTDAQRNQLRKDYVNARDNFWEAQNRTFREDDPIVKQIGVDLAKVQTKIQKDLGKLKDIVSMLQFIDTAVSLGSRLITLASTGV